LWYGLTGRSEGNKKGPAAASPVFQINLIIREITTKRETRDKSSNNIGIPI
jgi:hypothetical protein